MSIKPLDMQVLLPKSVEISHVKQIEADKSNVDQTQINIFQDNKLNTQKKTVTKSKENEKMQLNKDGKNKNSYYSKRKRKKKKNNGITKPYNENGSTFDIKI